MYKHIYIHIYTYIHTYIHTYLYIRTHRESFVVVLGPSRHGRRLAERREYISLYLALCSRSISLSTHR